MEGAIHASADSIVQSFLKITESKPVVKATATQQKLARLANNSDFQALVKIINDQIEAVKRLMQFNPKTDTVESFGFRCMAAELIVAHLEEIRDLPLRYKKLKEDEAK